MRHFTSITQFGDLSKALEAAKYVKENPFADQELGKNKTLLMIFFNSSLRTRLSTQKAALNLGMNVIVLDINQGAWKLETERGVIMDGDKPEHLLEAIPVMGSYCDVIGVRAFANFQSKEDDYNEVIVEQFIKYSGKPVFSMEAATRHPLQTFADLITIEEHKKVAKPKVVLTWAPHPKALPQAVANSFAEGQKNANLTTKELAAKVNLSPSPVFERQKRLEREGYIRKYVAVVDPIRTGNGIMVLCNVRLKHHSKEYSQQFTSVIAVIDEVVECFNTSGEYDYQLKIYARNMQDYQNFVLGTLGDLDCIGSLHSIFVIGEVKNSFSVPVKL